MTHGALVLNVQPLPETQTVEEVVTFSYFGTVQFFVTNAADII